MSEKRVGLLIDTLPELQALNRKTRQLMALQNVLTEVLPDNLATSVNVALIKAGELTLSADNGAVAANTSLVNTDPHGAGWLFKIKPANLADVDALMDEAAYLARQAS